ncbi:MAG: hypothetical protein R3B46_11605 [Phycisphaerales bacterium]
MHRRAGGVAVELAGDALADLGVREDGVIGGEGPVAPGVVGVVVGVDDECEFGAAGVEGGDERLAFEEFAEGRSCSR